MIQKLLHIFLIFLFFSLPLVHSELFDTLGIDLELRVNWNYEFTKSQFFIFFSGVIFLLFWVQSFLSKRLIIFPKVLFFALWVLWLSTIFSISSYTSFFGMTTKGHGTLLFLCLIWIYTVLIQQDKSFIQKLWFSVAVWAFFTSVLAIKEYYFPSFSYWDLSNRALGSFWHPNYLVWFLLVLIPLILEKAKKQRIFYIFLVPIIFTVFLTKSVWGIFLFIWFMVCISYIYFWKNYTQERKYSFPTKYIFICFSLIFTIIWTYLVIDFWLLTKLHSFLSRFYIWETTIQVLINNPKILLFWSWADTLMSYFESYKSPELYIFENYWFTADRPHNLILNILFHFWLWWIAIFAYLMYHLFKKYKNNYLSHTLILVVLFTLFHFLSIAAYLIIILTLACLNNNNSKHNVLLVSGTSVIIGFVCIFFSVSYYGSEIYAANWKYVEAINRFPYNYKNYEYISDAPNILKYAWHPTKNFYIQKLDTDETQNVCDAFTQQYKSVESLFYCGNFAWNTWETELAKVYYDLWLKKLPDLWNANSVYHSNFIISQYVDGTRFFSPKYSNLKEILERMGVEKDFN